MLYLLDTNILLAYIRQGLLYGWIEAQYALTTTAPTPLISIVTQGEINALSLRLAWGPSKQQRLNRLLNLFVAIPLPFGQIIGAYAQIDNHCLRNGLVLSKNDLWIAATANVTGATLLTTDHDFDSLHGLFLQRDWIDPNSRLSPPTI